MVFGNEGQGIGAKVAKHVDSRLLIPKAKTAGSESLGGLSAAFDNAFANVEWQPGESN